MENNYKLFQLIEIKNRYLPQIKIQNPFPQPISKQMSVLMLDLVGFTKFAGESTISLTSFVISQFYDQITSIINQHSGSIISYLGDGALLVFQNCQNAVNFTLQLKTVINKKLTLSAGLHRGTIMIGLFSKSYNVIGDAVNVSSRIEQSTRVLNCDFLCSEESKVNIKYTRYAGQVYVKGKGKICLYHVCDSNLAAFSEQIELEEQNNIECAYNITMDALKLYPNDFLLNQKLLYIQNKIDAFDFNLNIN